MFTVCEIADTKIQKTGYEIKKSEHASLEKNNEERKIQRIGA